MKIIAGSLKKKTLLIPKSSAVRPTSSKLRGQVFNICQGTLEGAHVLDLFAGSGAMGIEALSRGASHCVFVERDHQVAQVLRENLEKLELLPISRVLEMDVFKAIGHLRSEPFSFVYIDPPYHIVEPLGPLLEQIDATLPMADQANLFLETRKGSFTPPPLQSLALFSCRASGDSDLWHFVKTLR